MEGLISVIVPVYNVESYLGKCLDSIVEQSYQNLQIILVDDGATDSSGQICDEYAARDGRIQVIHKPNGGLSSARNAGLDSARGQFIAFVDSDDFIARDMYEQLHRAAVENNADIAVCAYYHYNEKQGSIREIPHKLDAPFNKSLDEDSAALTLAPYAWNKLYRRESFPNFYFPESLVYEDIATVYPLMSRAKKITIVDKPLYYYLISRENSIKDGDQNNLQMLDALSRCNEYFQNTGQFDALEDALRAANLHHIKLRLAEFSRYKDLRLKLNFAYRAMRHMNSFFVSWTKDPAISPKRGYLFLKGKLLKTKPDTPVFVPLPQETPATAEKTEIGMQNAQI
ncbi:MAG: glycosyltransferase [Oscillospiraceae bacterium]|nr:glycosyltransferase [Oscillospiraceae bacterium]